jgi:phosphodiesterase/alkaline phosphatase D-like protein
LAQQVMMMRADNAAGDAQSSPMGTWEGYSASRDRVLGGLHERGVDNLVVLTGDVHANFGADLKLDFDDPASPTVGTELVGTSISSAGDGADLDDWTRTIEAEGPHIAFANHQRGYVSCTVTPEKWSADYRVADKVTARTGAMSTRTTLTVANGVPGIQR